MLRGDKCSSMKDTVFKFNFVFNTKQKKQLCKVIVLMLTVSVLETMAIALMYPFLYMLLGTESITGSILVKEIIQLFGIENDNKGLIIRFSIILISVYIVKGIFTFLSNLVQSNWSAETKINLSIKVFEELLNQPYAFHLQSSTADVQYMVVQNIDRLFNFVAALMMLLSELLTGGLIVISLFSVDPVITLIAICVTGSILLGTGVILRKKIRRLGNIFQTNNIKMLKCVQQAIGGLKGIYVNKRQKYFVDNYSQSANTTFWSHRDYSVLASIPKIFTENMAMAIIFVFVGGMALIETNFLSMLPLFATFAMAAIKLVPICNHVNTSFYNIMYYKNALDEIYGLFEENVDINVDRINQASVNTKNLKFSREIRLEEVFFKYKGTEDFLFENLSLSIPIGKSVAFIGTTGAGKTTLADIILGLHKISSGRVLVDEKNIADYSFWWAKQIGYIPQYIYLCDDTIRKNIAFAIPEAEIDEAQVWECLKKAQLREFVESLPNGLDTVTGENGIRLSGGQRQRIGIARALYGNPPFIVLDEATSSLDYETEAAIIDAIDRLAGEKTLLIIAHRLTTIKNCDVIYRVENGSLTEVDKGMLGK